MLSTAEAAEEPIAEIGGEGTLDTEQAPKLTQKQQAELLRLKVDTVGRLNREGEQIQNVISVGMLVGGLGCKDRDSHHGLTRLYQPTPV